MTRERLSFRFGDAFDAQNERDQWLLALSLALNDTVLATNQLVKGFDRSPPHQNLYRARLVAHHLLESVKVVAAANRIPGVAILLDALPEDAKAHHESLRRITEDPAHPQFTNALHRARNFFGHYPEVPGRGSKTISGAMEEVADYESRLISGGSLADFRASYADLVAGELFFARRRNETPEDFNVRLEEFVEWLRDSTSAFWAFGVAVLRAAFNDLAAEVISREVIAEPVKARRAAERAQARKQAPKKRSRKRR